MKNSTLKKLCIANIAITAVSIACDIAANKAKGNSAVSLTKRVNLLTNPTFGARQFTKSLSELGVKPITAVRPLAEDAFTLGYTLGRRDELVNKSIDAKEQAEILDKYIENLS